MEYANSPAKLYAEDLELIKELREELSEKFGRNVTLAETIRIAVRAVVVETDRFHDAGITGDLVSI